MTTSPGAVILCGGESRRMGRPKAWLPIGDEVMLQRVVRLVGQVASSLVVVAAPGQALPPLPSSVVIARDPVRGRGPLQGLWAGLNALPDSVELAYATGTDVPFFEPAWVHRLLERIGDGDLAIPFCGGRHHPLAALYRRATALPAIADLLDADRLRPVFLMERLRTCEVTEEDLRAADPELEHPPEPEHARDYTAALGGAMRPGTPPRVRVELFGVPRLRAGTGEVWVEAGDVGSALRALAVACPALVGSVLSADGSLMPAYALNLDGRQFVEDSGTPLRAGDSLILLSLDVGG